MVRPRPSVPAPTSARPPARPCRRGELDLRGDTSWSSSRPAHMISYQVVYRLRAGAFFAEVPDFPEASALGGSLSEARQAVTSALKSAAERRLRRGEMLPTPD